MAMLAAFVYCCRYCHFKLAVMLALAVTALATYCFYSFSALPIAKFVVVVFLF